MSGGRVGRLAPGLRIASHNVTGLCSQHRLNKLLYHWHSLQLHIVCLQETWVGKPSGAAQQDLELWLHQYPHSHRYRAFWANNSTPDGNAGLAVLVREDLLTTGALSVELLPHQLPNGRLQVAAVTWAGHSFTLVNTYWHNVPAQRARFRDEQLLPALASHTARPLWLLGDFNFTHDPAIDRATHSPSHAAQQQEGRAFQQAVMQKHALVDLYRSHHPATRSFTFFRPGTAARLDRMYVTDSLARFIPHCSVAVPPVSDHHTVLAHLLPKLPTLPRGPGLRAIPGTCLHNQQAKDALRAWVIPKAALCMHMTRQQLLAYWPHLKQTLKLFLQRLRAEAATTQAAACASVRGAQIATRQAAQHLQTASPEALPAALQAAAVAHASYRQASAEAVRPITSAASRSWMAAGERPGPAITSLLRVRRSREHIPMLRDAHGRHITDPREMASHAAQHFAAFSAQRNCDLQAQQQVLTAMYTEQAAGRSRTIDMNAGLTAGSLQMQPQEVYTAIKHLNSDTVAGPDGLPPEAWQCCADLWAPVLAKLFTAIGSTGDVPEGFLQGVVTPHYKLAGDRHNISSYRPITLLNTDYRILAKVLATRFASALTNVIGPEQTAFLPGRLIGDNICFSQLLPAVLAAMGQQGAMVFLDIAKAYDTLDRDFLLAVMQTMGATAGMCFWVRTLLADTAATALVNGFQSHLATWEAGVRQGCPLSPVLYLFLAEALACWLRTEPALGVVVGGARVVSLHFADDTKVFLPNLLAATVGTLLAVLRTYQAAAGQAINVAKSAILPVGVHQQHVPDSIHSIPVVSSISSLGITHYNTGEYVPEPQPPHSHTYQLRQRPPDPVPSPVHGSEQQQWQRLADRLEATCTRVAALPLSAMGRGAAATAYAASQVLFHAEFSDVPPQQFAAIQQSLHYMVDTGHPRTRRPVSLQPVRGLRNHFLYGHPRAGGFGLLPFAQHTTARHAVWATRLLSALSQPGPVILDSPQRLWVHLASFLLRHHCPSLHPLHSLLLATISDSHSVARGIVQHAGFRLPVPPGPLRRMLVALQALGPMQQVITHDPAVQPLTAQRTHQWLLLRSRATPDLLATARVLGWATTPTATPIVPCLQPASVRSLTTHLLRPLLLERQAAYTTFVRQALGQPAAANVEHHVRTLSAVLQQVWRVPWDNSYKEVLWRLALNGIPGAGGVGISGAWRCPCGFQHTSANHDSQSANVPRMHAFWSCPLAAAVVTILQQSVPQLQRQHLWLLQCPVDTLSQHLWQVICLSALAAIHTGRRKLWALYVAAGRPANAQLQPILRESSDVAVRCFWKALLGFAERASLPQGWDLTGTEGHPFICRRPLHDPLFSTRPLKVSLPSLLQ